MKIPGGKTIVLAQILAAITFASAQDTPINEQSTAKVTAANSDARTITIETPKKNENIVPVPKLDVSRVGVQTSNSVPITLEDAIRRALQNNNLIELTRDDVRFQETQVRSLIGLYDPVFTFSPVTTRNSTTGSVATQDLNVNSRVDQFLPSGGNYSAFFNNARTENRFNQAQVSNGSGAGIGTSAVYSSNLGIRYTQPFFRNFGIDNTRRNIRIARKRLEQTDADFRRQAIDIIAQVQRVYWDLVFSIRDQQNQIANVNLARENLRRIEAQIAAGSAAPLARAEFETELANREGDVLLATQLVSTVENNLKQLLLRDAVTAEWSESWIPTDKPDYSTVPVVLDNAIKDAMNNRPELQRLKFAQEINQVDIDYFKNQTRPQIDLVSSFSLNGLAQSGTNDGITTNLFTSTGDLALLNGLNQVRVLPIVGLTPVPNPAIVIPPQPEFLFGGIGRSMSNMFRSDAPNFSIGVTISFPFRNRTAKANLAGAEVQRNQLDTQLRSQEQTVIVEVRNAVQAVETTRQVV
ncbi:MAG: TolC family protein, partial [Pyrinomonadaceae bacterium]